MPQRILFAERCLLLLAVGGLVFGLLLTSPTALYYNPSLFRMEILPEGDKKYYGDSLFSIEQYIMRANENNGALDGVILQIRVDGESINFPSWEQVYSPVDRLTYSVSPHVLTPVYVEKVYYVGADSSVAAGERYYLYEPFYYVTLEYPDEDGRFAPDTVVSYEYQPIIQGKTYLLLGRYRTDELEGADVVLSQFAISEGTYDLTTIYPAEWTVMNEILEKYAKG